MSLERKSLTELRGIAQTIGIVPKWDVGKQDLIEQIRGHVAAKVQQPKEPIKVELASPNADGKALNPEDITKALDPFVRLGLKLRFPDPYTWELSCNSRTDSGSMFMPLWNVVQCAKEIVKQ